MPLHNKLFQEHIHQKVDSFAIPELEAYYLFLVKENQTEFSTVFTGGKFRTSIQLVTRRHSLFPSSHTCKIL
jgi:hypothetical protein